MIAVQPCEGLHKQSNVMSVESGKRRHLMSTANSFWHSGLTGPHRNIAAYQGTPLRVMAGPGTGKTFAMMRRIARLLESGVTPASILAVTFTRTAARDLVEQLNSLGTAGAKDVVASTLHAISFSILSKNSVFLSTNRVARPLLKFERDCLVSDLGLQYGGRRNVDQLLAAFETVWATLQHQQPGWPNNPNEQNFHRDLMDWLNVHEAMLIGELVPLALDFISRNPASPDATAFDYVLVDEFQDLNRADQELVENLARRGSLTVIGDEDQSIYTSLRHARPEGIVDFHQTHANTHDEALSECKRCPQRVIEMANSLILRNHPQRPSTIQPSPHNPAGTVYVVQHNSLQEEVSATAGFIDYYLKRYPDVRRGEVLVLATRRLIGNRIRDELINLNQAAQSFFTEDCLDKQSAQEGFCLLRLLVHPDDPAALRAWLGLGSPDRRTNTYSRVRSAARQHNMKVKDFLSGVANGQLPPVRNSTSLMVRFKDLNLRLSFISGFSGMTLVDQLWPVGDSDCADVRGFATTLAANSPSNADLLETLTDVITQPELPGVSDDIIRIMSLQKSKGLTAKCVIVVGCMEGALPVLHSNYSQQERQQAYEEQRRLFYVALTRTTETLVVSSAATGGFGDVVAMGISPTRTVRGVSNIHSSPFVSELGPSAPPVIAGTAWRSALGF